MEYDFQFAKVFTELPYLLGGAWLTIQIAFIAFWGGAFLGIFGAIGKVYGGAIARGAIGAYVVFFTNTPALVQIFFLFYALPEAGIVLNPLTAVLIGMVLNSAAYLTDILRAGIISVRKAEIEAALTIGMRPLQVLSYVMLPHVAKTLFAPLSNFFVWLMLGSSIAALFAVEELTGRAINISTSNLRTIETFVVTASIYILLTIIASLFLSFIGRTVFRVKAKVM
ncbi:amino acid ABC transporter permease [Euryhalocaulis caribicus]|uniref:amino acid ABC transporter permease n=1 Tax=Euryhalocaulis caribicus TaxID=1161401 RepID=UPI0003A19C94|nr:amino acid ABC transporter permease [Euryhalocaulis caribicus]